MILSPNRNIMPGLLFGSAWLVAYGFLLPHRADGGHDLFWPLVGLFGLGIFISVVLSDNPISRAGWVVGACALSSVAVHLMLSGNTDPEGSAWVWFYAITPLTIIVLTAGIGLAARFKDLR